MDLLIILTYVAFAWAMFKIFKIPVNKWTIPTAALGGIFIVSGLILLMNYNHPYTFKAQKAVISIPVVPQVTGVVIEVTDKKNTLIKKGEVLFRLDPTRYQARVDRLMADIVTAEHKQRALGAELDEMAANTQQAKATRDKFAKELQLTLEDIQAQHKAVEKYLEYLKTASDDAESPILQRERVWSEFAKVLESASNPIKKIVYFETYTLIATINRSYENKPDSTKADNTRALEEYCEFLRQKLGISPDIARRLEDIVQFDLDSYKHITDTITLH